ncbi:MAG TPA: hypothetical protein VN764_10690 [Polyangiaceae bacterium]|nr:hypothetical protein [Polyangiaceae bacterium]
MSFGRVGPALRRARGRALGLLMWGASALGCNPQLPGPLECERMTYAVIKRTPTDAVISPKVRRVADRLIQGCLTVPFDKPAVACASQGYSFLRCMDDLGRRAPERNRALRALVADLDQLGAGG